MRSPLLVLLPLLLFSPALASHAPFPPLAHHKRTTTTCPTSSIVGAFWPSWLSKSTQSPSQFPWSATDLAFYFSLATTKTGIAVPEASVSDIQAFVKDAHSANKEALVSIGGWTGSVYFSTLVASSSSRTQFANAVKNLTTTYGFDGVDFDWEFVGRQGAGSNVVSSTDAANFLAFLKLLRKVVPKPKILHASVPTSGFTGPDGKALSDYAAYAPYLDYITIMAYDVYASAWSSTTGPNAPLQQCNANSGSDAASVSLWTNGNFPACQILLGVPGYSHLFETASAKLATTTFGGVKTTAFQSMTNTTQPADPSYTYLQLVSKGWLTSDGSAGAGGYVRYWDACTSTPFLFNAKTRIFIAYDDAKSIGTKATWARSKGLAGVNFYDSTGPSAAMFSAARSGLAGTYKSS